MDTKASWVFETLKFLTAGISTQNWVSFTLKNTKDSQRAGTALGSRQKLRKDFHPRNEDRVQDASLLLNKRCTPDEVAKYILTIGC